MPQNSSERQHNDYYARMFTQDDSRAASYNATEQAWDQTQSSRGNQRPYRRAEGQTAQKANQVNSYAQTSSRRLYQQYDSTNMYEQRQTNSANAGYQQRYTTNGARVTRQTVPGGSSYQEKQGFVHNHPVVLAAILALMGIAIGVLLGFVFFGMGMRTPNAVSPSLTASQLKTVVGAYTYDGTRYTITAEDAITATKSLESAKNSDGTYATPSSDMILSYARNQILNEMVREAGITVTENEVAQYAQSIVGTSDMNYIATLYDMEADQAYDIMSQAASVAKLRASIEGTTLAAPEPPVAPADGNNEVGNPEYAAYIVGLLGQYWDATHGTWATTDNPYYEVLKDMVFTYDSANYESALAAYAVAYDQYQKNIGGHGQTWTDYVNSYLDKASIVIATLRA